MQCSALLWVGHWPAPASTFIVCAMARSSFLPADRVRVVHLEAHDRDVDSAVDPPRQPRIGDTGTVIAEVADGIYLVERCTDDGRSLWVAEFLASELGLVEGKVRSDE